MVNWNAEKDQIILKGIFKFHDIKSTAPLLKYLAKEIGENCTPKAVSHRLNNIRNNGKPATNGSSATSTPSKAATTSTKTSGRTKAGVKKKPVTESDDEDGPRGLVKDDEEAETLTAVRGKRKMSTPKRSYAESNNTTEDSNNESDYTPIAKRVKAEPLEDDGTMFEPLGDDFQYEV